MVNYATTTLALLAFCGAYALCATLAQTSGAFAAWPWMSQTEPTGQRPVPSLGHALAYDEKRGRVVLFGCSGADRNPSNETWEWDGQRWLRVSSEGPAARKWPAMAYDIRGRKTFLFGGRNNEQVFGDTWEWNGKGWKQLNVSGPSSRGVYAAAYDRLRRQMVFFGGGNRVGESWRLHDDTWRWDGSAWNKADGR